MINAIFYVLAASCAALDFDGGLPPGGALELPPPPPVVVGRPAGKPQNVILITWDGVRREEFFANKADAQLSTTDTAALLPRLWTNLAAQGTIWGDFSGPEFRISNIAGVSLPAYESIFAGYAQPCLDNDCPRVPVETFPERLVREQGFPREKVAAFASWQKIEWAFQHVSGALPVDAPTGNRDTRPDTDTWAKAMSYLSANKPRFLYISLNDTDDLGHAGDYPGYLAALRRNDVWLSDLIAALQGMGDYGANTTVLLTTDHGRGVGEDWRNHNIMRPTALRIFLYARGPLTLKGARGAGVHYHSDLRPTIEGLLGLAPQTCEHCGAPLAEVMGAAPSGLPTSAAR